MDFSRQPQKWNGKIAGCPPPRRTKPARATNNAKASTSNRNSGKGSAGLHPLKRAETIVRREEVECFSYSFLIPTSSSHVSVLNP